MDGPPPIAYEVSITSTSFTTSQIKMNDRNQQRRGIEAVSIFVGMDWLQNI